MKRERITAEEFEDGLNQFQEQVRDELKPFHTVNGDQEITLYNAKETVSPGVRYSVAIGVCVYTLAYDTDTLRGILAVCDKVKNYIEGFEFAEEGIIYKLTM